MRPQPEKAIRDIADIPLLRTGGLKGFLHHRTVGRGTLCCQIFATVDVADIIKPLGNAAVIIQGTVVNRQLRRFGITSL